MDCLHRIQAHDCGLHMLQGTSRHFVLWLHKILLEHHKELHRPYEKCRRASLLPRGWKQLATCRIGVSRAFIDLTSRATNTAAVNRSLTAE